jgi:hypothetical protein
MQALKTETTYEAPQRCSVFSHLAILLLLFSVAGLSTVAKNSVYYQNSGSIRYVSIASKMNVAHAPVAVDRTPLRPTLTLVPSLLFAPSNRRDEPEVPSIRRIDSVVGLQFRPPPAVS